MRKLFLLSVTFLLSGCAFSQVDSYVDRGRDVQRFQHVVVMASNLPLGERQAAEAEMAAEVRKAGLMATLGTDIMPPTRLSDAAYIDQQVAKSGADGVLVVYQTDRGSTQGYVPPTVIAPARSISSGFIGGYGTIYNFGNSSSVQMHGTYSGTTTYSPPVVVGGYYVEKPNATFGAALYDIRLNGRKVWMAEVQSTGGGIDDFKSLAKDAARAIVDQLRKDGLL